MSKTTTTRAAGMAHLLYDVPRHPPGEVLAKPTFYYLTVSRRGHPDQPGDSSHGLVGGTQKGRGLTRGAGRRAWREQPRRRPPAQNLDSQSSLAIAGPRLRRVLCSETDMFPSRRSTFWSAIWLTAQIGDAGDPRRKWFHGLLGCAGFASFRRVSVFECHGGRCCGGGAGRAAA